MAMKLFMHVTAQAWLHKISYSLYLRIAGLYSQLASFVTIMKWAIKLYIYLVTSYIII